MKTRLTVLTTLLLTASLGILASCSNNYQGPLPRRDQLNYPIGLTFHPNGKYLYVVNSNFDARYRPDLGGTVSVIDTDTLKILPQNTPYLPSFGGHIQLNDDATIAYATARNNNVVVAYDVADDGSALFCGTNDSGERVFRPGACEIGSDDPKLPSDPFDLAVFSVQSGDKKVDVVNLAHLRGSRVSSVSLQPGDVSSVTVRTAPLLSGGNAIAQRPGTHDLYVAGRNTNGVAIFQPYIDDSGTVQAIIQRGSFAINHESQAVDARGLAFNDAGDRLYVISQRPNALHVVKIVPDNPDTGEGTSYQVTSSIPMPGKPSDIALHTTPQGRHLAYVTSYADRSVEVVDLDSETIIDEILLDASPYSIAIEPPTSGCASPTDRCRAFVTLFDDARRGTSDCSTSDSGCGSVAVIDINPLHRNPDAPELSRYDTVISKIQ